MDIVLLSIALFLLVAAGWGVAALILPERESLPALELSCLGFLLGSVVISFSSFILGYLFSGRLLIVALMAICAATFLIGWRRTSPLVGGQRVSTGARFLFLFNVAQIGVVAWVSRVRVLGWDGLFNYEVKARMAALNGGAIPLAFFSDPSRPWMHAKYPLLLPLSESWLYLWLGRPHQGWVKIIFVAFFATALGLFYIAGKNYGFSRLQLWIAPVVLCTAPLLLIGDGSASSGYGDFPLAVFYLAAVIYLIEFNRTGSVRTLLLSGLLSASCCWLKQEGAILWACLMLIAAILIILSKGWRGFLPLMAMASFPGLLVIIGWQSFVFLMQPPGDINYASPSLDGLRENLWRAPAIARSCLAELINLRHWGILWILALGSSGWILIRQWRNPLALIAIPAVVIPVLLYAGIYIFSFWPDFVLHLESSYPRLLIHVSLTAALLIGGGYGAGRSKD